MTLAIVRAEGVTPAPWRNGGGVTRELLAWPRVEDWIVRVSVADVAADGPFSSFHGVERWFAVVDGEGVELTHDGGAPIRLRAGDAVHRFRGEAVTYCRLVAGPTRDFNLMVRRDLADAVVAPLAAGPDAGAAWSACFAATPLRVRLAGTQSWQLLPERSLAWTAAPSALDVDAPAGARGWRIAAMLSGGGK